jgi:Flp pilus assembly pilin Flp
MIQLHPQGGKAHALQKGAGLTEYALILVLVAVVVIGITAVLGDSVVKTYCTIVLSVDPSIEAPMCDALDVSCNGITNGATVSSPVSMSATASDSVGTSSEIDHVTFYVDGAPVNTEYHVTYCLENGNGPCTPKSLSPGSHTISAVAHDTEGNTGSCSVSFTVSS